MVPECISFLLVHFAAENARNELTAFECMMRLFICAHTHYSMTIIDIGGA